MKQYTSFSEWKKDQSAENMKLITEVSVIIQNVDSTLEKVVKWGQGCWTEGKNHKLFIHCAADHIQVGFYRGAELRDPQKILEGKGQFVKHVKLFAGCDINTRVLAELIKQVV